MSLQLSNDSILLPIPESMLLPTEKIIISLLYAYSAAFHRDVAIMEAKTPNTDLNENRFLTNH